MSLADKIIKNTFYYILFQLFGFLFPLVLTPFIISKIGEVQYGIYALVLGFIGLFGLFDLSISSSFIIFISRYYFKKDFLNLNKYFNTGLFFYIFFSTVIVLIGYFFSKPLLSLLNIPPELFNTSISIFYIGLLVFFISSAFTIFISTLIALQKMYITSAAGIFISFINAISIFVILSNGYGLEGIMWVQFITVTLNTILNIWYAKTSIPELRIGFKYLGREPIKEMAKFGTQMQISKLASFASEKYDEFLLAYFSVLNNVTYFNVANRISRTGRLIPFQLIPQVAPVASELNARQDNVKLHELFLDTTKYLTLVSVPIFVFIFIFSDLIITTWLGPGYELSFYILRILVVGQLVNMTLSAPGNSIIPNIGLPKFQMNEGLINLGINIVLSFLLIKYYGILGAAIGNVTSTLISSAYIFFISANFFGEHTYKLFSEKYFKPIIASIGCGLFVGLLFFLSNKFLFAFNGRLSGIIYLIVFFGLFFFLYGICMANFSYINEKDKMLLAKIILKVLPKKLLLKDEKNLIEKNNLYKEELVSIFIVTHNRLELLKKCVLNLLPTLENINYELIVIDNASTDNTKEFLDEIKSENERVKIITTEKNIGINAKSLGAEASKGEFIIGMDDDVIMFPDKWIEQMVCAYRSIPKMGYLATDVVQDETTTGAKYPHEMYNEETYDDAKIKLLVGPTGGWCFMISRDVYNKIGKFITFEGRVFFSEDGDYVNRIINKGMKYGILSGVKVYHATGEFHNKDYKKVFDEKYKDFKKAQPLIYKIKTKLKRTFSFNRYITKIKEIAAKEIK